MLSFRLVYCGKCNDNRLNEAFKCFLLSDAVNVAKRKVQFFYIFKFHNRIFSPIG